MRACNFYAGSSTRMQYLYPPPQSSPFSESGGDRLSLIIYIPCYVLGGSVMGVVFLRWT